MAEKPDMRLAFFTPRRNFLKHYGPLIGAAKRRGWRTALAIPITVLATGKDNAHLDREGTLRESGADLSYPAWDGWYPERNGFDWVVSIGLRLPPWLAGVRERSRQAGVRWASLDHVQESLLAVLQEGLGVLDGWDVAATGSLDGLETLEDQLASAMKAPAWSRDPGEEMKRIWGVFRAVGMPHLDPLAGMDRATCRAKWNLPAGRIVLLAPAARPTLLCRWWWRAHTARNPIWRQFCWLKAHRPLDLQLMPYRDILRAFRRWADRHGAYVVAKVRAKTPCVHFLNGIADRVIGDEAFHPFTTLELCRAADAYVGLASAMAIEATAAGLPQVHVLAYPSEAYEVPAYLPFRRRFYFDCPGLWSDWGIERHDTFTAKGQKALEDWAAGAPWPDRAGPGPGSLARLTGPPDGRASERFLDLLKSS